MLWTYRGGDGIGIATALEFELALVASAHAVRDGRTHAPSSFPQETLARLADIRQRHDPRRIFVLIHPRIHA